MASSTSYAVWFTGGNISTTTASEDNGRFLQHENNASIVPLHDYQRITKCDNYRYIDFMHEDNNADGEYEDGIMQFDISNPEKIRYYRKTINGSNAEDNHNYYWTNCNSAGHLVRFGGAHNQQFTFAKTHSPGNNYAIHSWTALTAPATSNYGTYPRGCLATDDDWHIFWRGGDGVSSSHPYLEHAKYNWNGTSYDSPSRDTLVSWDYTNDANLNTSARIYFEMYCDTPNNDVYLAFSVRDGNNGSAVSDYFWYVVFIKYEMDTGNAYQFDGTSVSLPMTEATADKIETGNRFYINSVGYDETYGGFPIYTKQNSATSGWFGSDNNAWLAYYNSGVQKVQITTGNTVNAGADYLKLLGTDTQYIFTSGARIFKFTDPSSLTEYTSSDLYINCNNSIMEQNPDPNYPILCAKVVDGAIKLYQRDLP